MRERASHGWPRWLYAAAHQDIGTLSLWFLITIAK